MPKQKMGQHFLINQNVAEREVAYASLRKDDVVLEIGPGKGILTHLLAQKVRQVIAIELDPYLVESLQSSLPDNVLLIHDDAVRIDFCSLPKFHKIVANLPFQISSPITFKFLQYPFSKAVLIYQKDFAERMIAGPGEKHYSRLSVGIYYKTHCRILEQVPRTDFHPVPNVDSCIVELIPRTYPPFQVKNEDFFFAFTKFLFTHRRKQIKNSLKYEQDVDEDLPYLDQRVEALSPQQIGRLADLVFERKS